MRIACGGVQHETNTFASVPTTLADFERDSRCGPDFLGGPTLERLYRGTGTIQGGYFDGADDVGAELLPLLSAHAQPAGIVEQAAFDHILTAFLDRLRAVLPVDGVALDLHGAMVTERHPDAEGAFIAAVRELVGPAVPIVVTLDLHANITQRMADMSDVIIGFDTYPHVDMRERGREAVQLLARIIRGEVKPTQAFRQLPLITLPPKQCTLREPMHSLMERVFQMEAQPRVLTATVAMGFPFADIFDAGVSVLVTTDNDLALANRKADELAGWLWELRDALQPELMPVNEVILFARRNPEGLVIYADGSDNPGGGAPCDGTVVLRALIEADFQGAVIGVLCDPETVAQAHAAGVGATIAARIGGKTDDKHGTPVEVQAYVRTLSDGHFVHRGPMRQGVPAEFGPMALLVVGGVEIALATNRMQLLDREMLRIVGVSPEYRKLLVVKSAVHFRADVGPLASHIFDADTPGIHRPDFGNFDYQHLRRPIYPVDSQVSDP
jgi:microcystin degradation protein MlrC